MASVINWYLEASFISLKCSSALQRIRAILKANNDDNVDENNDTNRTNSSCILL